MSTSEERLERLVSEMLADVAPSRPPNDLVPESERAVDAVRRWPRWLALLKEPPMRHTSQLVVGSPTARVATILIATLLLTAAVAGAGIAGSRLLAASSSIVVDQSGAGTVTTIAAALEMAEDGDEVLVRPGTYVEAVTIDHDLTLKGDGPRDDIVLMAPSDGPTRVPDPLQPLSEPYALLITESDAVVAGLTLRGEAAQVQIDGGAPTIEDLRFDGVGRPHDMPSGKGLFPNSIAISGGSRAIVRGNTLADGGPIAVFADSGVQILDNRLSGGPSIIAFFPADAMLIRGNIVTGTLDRGIGVFGESEMTIEGNVVRDALGDGISVGFGSEPDNDPIVRDNTISGSQTGINVHMAAEPTIEGNHISANATGLLAGLGSDGMVVSDNDFVENAIGMDVGESSAEYRSNRISGGIDGVVLDVGLLGGQSPTLADNTIEGASGRGVYVADGSQPNLSGNRVCGNGRNLVYEADADVSLDDLNEICEDASTG